MQADHQTLRVNIVNCMKNIKAIQLQKPQENRIRKSASNQRHTFTPTNRNVQTRLVQYEHIAKKAKQQLRELEAKRKNSPQNTKFRTLPAENEPIRNQQLQNRLSARYGEEKQLAPSFSQRYLRKEVKGRSPIREGSGEEEKVSAEGKLGSPKKRPFIDSNEYKKLHDKLDSIEHKITDMKKNLQRKKEQKQRVLDGRGESDNKKLSLKGLVTQVPEYTDLHTFNSNPYSPRHNVYYVSELVRAYQDSRSLARQHLINSLSILKLLEKGRKPSDQEARKSKLSLLKRKGWEDRKTVVFDLDETLIHCNDNLNPPYSVKLPIKFPTGEIIEAGVNIRPYAREILRNLSKHFQVIVFTASHSCYANVVIDHLDPEGQWIQHRLFREHCHYSQQGLYVKDLRVLNRDLSSLVLVDNAAYSYAYQLDNGIPILPYYHGTVDFQLKMLEDYLMKLLVVKDVREANSRIFKLGQYKRYYNQPEKLVEELYLNQ